MVMMMMEANIEERRGHGLVISLWPRRENKRALDGDDDGQTKNSQQDGGQSDYSRDLSFLQLKTTVEATSKAFEQAVSNKKADWISPFQQRHSEQWQCGSIPQSH